GCKALHIGRMLMTDKITDPVALWQKMVGEMEKGFNSFANKAMETPEFSEAMNRAGGVAAGAQKQFGDLMVHEIAELLLSTRSNAAGPVHGLRKFGRLHRLVGEGVEALLHLANHLLPQGDRIGDLVGHQHSPDVEGLAP